MARVVVKKRTRKRKDGKSRGTRSRTRIHVKGRNSTYRY